ncbi:MAG: hypothetical protein M1822_005232 [Bathelium mastoideum]|nr:MAG: hypothetical protein M1822_005232 [Bathelium mastoideum]
MGFDAVWISPITFQLQGSTMWGESYAGYWQQNLYQLNSNFGTASDLKALSAALHSQGMYLMVDIVVNHNAWNGPPSSVNYTAFYPFNNQSDYHQFCEVDYSNATSTQDCWLGDTNVPLPDLKTESSTVISGYQTWISQLMSNYSIDGLRLDTVLEVDQAFWSPFSQAAGSPYMVGEVFDGDVGTVCNYQGYIPGVLNYPTYFPLVTAFQSSSGNIDALIATINALKSTCQSPSLLGSFSENADVPRFAQLNPDFAAAHNVISFTLLADGIPILYQGQEQHYASVGGSGDPFNREAIWFSQYNQKAPLYSLVQLLLKLRKWAISVDQNYLSYNGWPIYNDTHTLAMRKGYPGKQVLAVLTNVGSQGANYSVELRASYTAATAGQLWMDTLTCGNVTADSQGNINITIVGGVPRILFPKTALESSGICGL